MWKIKKEKIFFSLFFFFLISISKSEISLYHQIEEFQAIREIKIKHFWIIEKSEKIYLDEILLEKNNDYTIDYETGIITILCPVPPKKKIRLEYDILPINLKKSYGAEFQEKEKKSSELKKADLKIKGYKKIGINLISNQDVSLEQSLKLNISGNLDANTTINAYFCDENIPMQTQGITKEIRELDNIFVDIKSPFWNLTFGDYTIECPDFEFVSLNKKLEGLKINGKIKEKKITALSSISKGEFAKINITTKTGISKYELKLNGKFVVILAGTEKIWFKGILMKKGIDYVIDYNKGEIEFISQKTILGGEEVVVSFEYLKENYMEKILGFTSYNLLYSPNFSLNFNVFNYENENVDQNLTLLKNQEKLLPSHENYLISAINAKWKIFSFLNLGSEYAFSHKNTLLNKIEKGNALNLKFFTKQDKLFFKNDYYYLSENFISDKNTLNPDFLNRWQIFNFNENPKLKCLEIKTNYEISELSLFDTSWGKMIENYKTKNISTHRLNFNYNFSDYVKYEFRNITSVSKIDKYQMLKLKKKIKPFTYSVKFEIEEKKDFLILDKKNYIGESFLQGNWDKINCNYLYQIKFDKNQNKINSYLNKIDLFFNKIKDFYFAENISMIDYYENEKKQKDFLIYIDTKYDFSENLLTNSNYKIIQKLITRSVIPYFTSQEMEQLKLVDKNEIKSGKIKEKTLNLNIEINENKRENSFQFFTKFPFKIILNFNDEIMQNKLVKKKYNKRFVQKILPQNKFISVVGEISNENLFNSFYYPSIFQKTSIYEIDFNLAPFRKLSYLLEIEKNIIKKDFQDDLFYWKDFEKEQNDLIKATFYLDIKTNLKLNFSYRFGKKNLLYNYQKNIITTNEFSFSITRYMGHYGVLNTEIGSKNISNKQPFLFYSQKYYEMEQGEFFKINYYGKINEFLNINFNYYYKNLLKIKPISSLKLEITAVF